MVEAHQRCRDCGIQIPAGFTHCDICFYKFDAIEAKSTKPSVATQDSRIRRAASIVREKK